MPATRDDPVGVFVQRLPPDAGHESARVQARHDQVELVALEARPEAGGDVLDQLDPHGGDGGLERPDRARHELRPRHLHGADANDAADAAGADRRQLGLQLARVVDDPARVPDDRFQVRGRLELAAPLVEPDAQGRLDVGEPLRHRRLARVERSRGAGEAARVDDRQQHFQVTKLQAPHPHGHRTGTTCHKDCLWSESVFGLDHYGSAAQNSTEPPEPEMLTLPRFIAAALLAVLCSPGWGQSYPSQPITIVVPFPAGGGSDLIARRLAEGLRAELGQPIVIDNRAGAGGNIGANLVAKARPDGYTLMLTAAPFAIAPAMYKDLPFDPVRDFTAITQVATVPLLVVTRAGSPINNIAELLAQARQTGSHLTFASFGNGSPPHLVGESINLLGHVKMTHVPYKGTAAALPDVMAGRIDIAILDAVSTAPFVKSGQLKALAITGPKRAPALPGVPTLVESGIDFKTVGWHAMFGPAKLPPEVVARLSVAVNKAIATPAMKAFIVEGGSIPIEPALDARQWDAQFREDVRTWARVARESGATIE